MQKVAWKYLPKTLLARLNKSSIKAGRNRNLRPECLRLLLDECPVVAAFDHNEREIHVEFVADQDNTLSYLDVSYVEFDSIPEKIFTVTARQLKRIKIDGVAKRLIGKRSSPARRKGNGRSAA